MSDNYEMPEGAKHLLEFLAEMDKQAKDRALTMQLLSQAIMKVRGERTYREWANSIQAEDKDTLLRVHSVGLYNEIASDIFHLSAADPTKVEIMEALSRTCSWWLQEYVKVAIERDRGSRKVAKK